MKAVTLIAWLREGINWSYWEPIPIESRRTLVKACDWDSLKGDLYLGEDSIIYHNDGTIAYPTTENASFEFQSLVKELYNHITAKECAVVTDAEVPGIHNMAGTLILNKPITRVVPNYNSVLVGRYDESSATWHYSASSAPMPRDVEAMKDYLHRYYVYSSGDVFDSKSKSWLPVLGYKAIYELIAKLGTDSVVTMESIPHLSDILAGRIDTSKPTEAEDYTDLVDIAREKGMKFDKDKIDYTLIPWGWPMDMVTKVLEHGAKKYSRSNWQQVSKIRYVKALMRHVIAIVRGERLDKESGLPHAAHAACCCLFILWHENPKTEEGNNETV